MANKFLITKLIPFLLAAGLATAGCTKTIEEFANSPEVIAPLGQMVTRPVDADGFDQVEVHNGFQVEVVQGDGYGVAITVDEAFESYLDVGQRGSKLILAIEPGHSYQAGDKVLKATVTMPFLARLALHGGSSIELGDFDSLGELEANLTGGSRLTGSIMAGEIVLDLSGGSYVSLSGSAGTVKVDASGGSRAELASLLVEDADVNTSGGSTVVVKTSERLTGEVSGGSGFLP